MLNSYNRSSPQQDKNLNHSKITTNILPPQITSTPCISPSKSRKVSPLITPRRFLGPRRYALSSNGSLSPLKTVKDPPGPLLTSTSYNINVSTYIDSKSPGYTGRLIQYNEEGSQNQQLTHQEKYGSPGMLPIVHLFKKDIPVITPKQATVRIGTPEIKGQYSQEHNRLLLEGIVRTNSVIKENNCSGNDVSTRSVLDALKEISRKRIHANEDYDTQETKKKLRRDCVNGDVDCSKRNREIDSPTSDVGTSQQATKKLCTIDAVLASKTSSMYGNYGVGSKRKTIEDVKTKVSPLNKKKFNNAETQTIGASSLKADNLSVEKNNISPVQKDTVQKETVQKETQSTIVAEETTSPPKRVLKVFDDKPLEIIRKNRLGALLSALTGHDIPPIPMEDRKKALEENWHPQNPEKKLISILSSPDKQPKASEKHVTFNISENFTKSDNSTQFTENALLTKDPAEKLKIDSSEQKSSSKNQDSFEGDTYLKNSSNIQIACQSNKDKLVANDNVKDVTATSSIGAKDFVDKNSSLQSNTSTSAALITEPKMNVTSSNITASFPTMIPSLLPRFGITQPLGNSSEGEIFTNSVSPSTKTNSLGLPAALPLTTTESSLGKGTSLSPFTFNSSKSVTSSTTFGKSSPALSNIEGSKDPSFSTPNVSESKFNSTSTVNTSVTSSTLACTTSNISTTNSNTPLLASTAPNFGILASSTTNFAFGVSTSIPTFVSSTKNIVSTTTTTSSLKELITSTAPTYATGGTHSGGFSFTSNLPAFATKSTMASGTATSVASTNTFANSLNFSDSQTNTVFGTTKTTVSYSSPGSTQPVYSITSTPSFVTNSSSKNSEPFVFGSGKAFGHPSTSPTSTGLTLNSQSGMTLGTNTSASTASNIHLNSTFGTTKNMFSSAGNNTLGQSTSVVSFGTTTTPAFGNSITPAFGTTSTPAFGITSMPSSSAKPVFGNTSMPAFGTTIAPTFGTNSAPAFGTTNATTFGTTTIPAFGTTAAQQTFGTTTAPTFGTTTAPTFGTTTAPTFGTTTAPTFGTSTAPTFGKTTVPTFGNTTAPIFGSTTAPAFGTNSTPSFGTTTASSFGSSSAPSFTTTPAFGITTSSSAFGTSSPLNLAAPNMNSSTFGNTPNFVAPSGTKSLFGTPNTNTFENTKPISVGFATSNNFGLPNTTSPTFGTNNSSFGAPSSAPLFGTTNTSSFGGSSATPAFGATTATFGAALPFGTTPTTSIATFNSNNANLPFGNSSTNSFNTFGNTNTTFNPVTTSSSFGSNNNFVNSASTTFGNNMANNAFGKTNTASSFGTGANATTFGNNNSAATNGFVSGFGTTATKPEQSNVGNNMFGNNSTFGSLQSSNTPNNTGASSNGVFTFGSANTQSSLSNGVFAFGSAESSTPFKFSVPGTSGNGSGPPASSFQPGGLNGPMPNMFNIGSGSSTTQNRSRATVRGKRRT